MFFVYILQCVDGSFYTGCTKNVEKRLKEHQNGRGARYTKTHKPQRIAYTETCVSRSHAMKRERAIKQLSHQQKAKLIKSTQM